MSDYPLIPLRDLCTTINSGGTPSRREPGFWVGGAIPWIKTGELNDWKVQSIEERITEAGLNNSSAKLYPSGTILIAMYGDGRTITTMGIVDTPAATNQACCALIANSAVCDPIYLFYAIKERRHELLNLVVAGAQRNLSVGTIRNFPVRLPPLPTQRRIASILRAYDDLIEVDRRRIAVLEEMARGLFEEWFVRFRFPGHEQVPILDTPNGPLPEGWRYDTLGNVSGINAASLRPANAPSEIGYIDISSVSPGKIDAINHMPFAEAPGRARRIVTDGSILWSNVRPNRRSFAVVLDPTPEIVASTGFTVLDARETSFAYLYYWVTTDNFVGYLVGNAQGAAYPAVTAATFERAAILLPPSILVERFTDFAEPMLRLADSLRKTNGSLAASRDLLLPRLISGQLSVAQAERELEEAA
ncbi:restriction endonuclease subunit S [Sinorhizobium fredii]|uniref:restriction endonuclease subunit S n=1 Tax=Rhizobium fredii TaxID=380 RepID=UPI0004B99562|nr:restriction endonuclease subunit S [Sinorhizobium fredii]